MRLGRYRRELDGVMQTLLRAILTALLGTYYATNDERERARQIDVLAPELVREVRVARNRAHQISARQLVDEAPSGRRAYVPPQRGYAEDAVRTVLEKEMKGSPTQAANAVASKLISHAEQAARDTIADAVLDEAWTDEPQEDSSPDEEDDRPRSRLRIDYGDLFDEDEDLEEDLNQALQPDRAPVRPIGWARIPTGSYTCGFCLMLASRPGSGQRRFYTSEDAAGGEMATAEYYGTALFVNRYHRNCDCVVVPVYDPDDWQGKEMAEYLYNDVYLPAVGGKPVQGWRSNKYAENDVVQAIERWLKTHEINIPNIRETM